MLSSYIYLSSVPELVSLRATLALQLLALTLSQQFSSLPSSREDAVQSLLVILHESNKYYVRHQSTRTRKAVDVGEDHQWTILILLFSSAITGWFCRIDEYETLSLSPFLSIRLLCTMR